MNHHRPSYTITFPDEDHEEDILKDFPIMQSLMKSQAIKPTIITPQSPDPSPQIKPLQGSPLLQMRRNFAKLEKQKTEESSRIDQYNRLSQSTQRISVTSNKVLSHELNPSTLNSVASNYELRKPNIELNWDKENQIYQLNRCQSNSQFQTRLQKDVQRRQGNLKRHDDYLRKSRNKADLQSFQQGIYKTMTQLGKSNSQQKKSYLLTNLKSQLDELFEQLNLTNQNALNDDVSRQMEEIEQIRHYYNL